MANINNQNPFSPPDLLSPYCRVTIGSIGSKEADVFEIGDGRLKNVSVTLGEGKVQSSCRFTVLDPEQKLTDKYLAYIESVGGLTPVEAPEETPGTNSVNTPAVDDGATTGQVLYEKTIASTFGFGESTQGGDQEAYSNKKIDFNGQYAAMIHPNFVQGAADSEKWRTFYKYAKMRVTNLANNKSTVVTVVSTGPWALDGNKAARPLRPNPERKIDLTPGAFYALTSPGTRPTLLDVKIEWLEAGTTTSPTTTSQTPQPKSRIIADLTKKAQKTLTDFTTFKIGDWPTPKVGATKNIIVLPGHLTDLEHPGTNGTSNSSVTYKGVARTLEFVANDNVTEMLISRLTKAGFNVIPAPTPPSGRSDVIRRAYHKAVGELKERNNAYALEIHFDAPYNSKGQKSGRPGVIAAWGVSSRTNPQPVDVSGKHLSVMDVALARALPLGGGFGTYPLGFSDFGGPMRGVTLLELDRLNETLTNATLNAVNTGNYQPLRNLLSPYVDRIVAALTTVTSGVAVSNEKANSSVNSAKSPQVENTPAAKTLTGAQITIELGYGGKTISATSFIHVGLRYSLFEPHALEFTGQAASWVLTQRVKNTAYQKITFKKLAQKITSSYGMKLEMPEDGPLYEYFPQRGQTDYEALLIEARRIGYRVYTKGATLYIQPRKGIDPNQQIFVLQYGENMGTFFEVTHQASTDSKGGARSSQPGSNNSTGERKFEIDPDSGQIKQKRKENVTGTGNSLDASTTGSPLPLPAPKTTGDTNASDSQRKANEDRIKGIVANAEFPTTPEALTLDPDTPFKTEGISTVLDRFWVVDTITHEYEGGKLSTKLSCYSPITNKKDTADINNGEIKTDSNNPVGKAVRQVFDNVAGLYGVVGFILPTKGIYRSPFGPRGGRNHNGIDIANKLGTPIYAAASGTAIISQSGCKFSPSGNNKINRGCGGGFGNYITITHANGYQTIYAHLSEINIENNTQVTQGQLIGTMGNSGGSNGVHLHWEVLKNGRKINPSSVIKLPSLFSSIL